MGGFILRISRFKFLTLYVLAGALMPWSLG